MKKKFNKTLKLARKKTILKVIFLLLNVDTWKLDVLYSCFRKDDRFEAIVVICPFVSKGEDFLFNELRKSKEYCEKRNYNYFVSYDEENSTSLDAKSILKPDIVFFTNPNELTTKKLLISNFLDLLTCYVPYSFRIDTLYEYEYDNDLVNYTWINFYESSIHKKLACNYARNKGRNVFVSGFPFMDSYSVPQAGEDIWKKQVRPKKKIIWAPHWTIKGYVNPGLDWSCFITYCDVVLAIAEEYESTIQLAIKPHPFLKSTLSQSSLWGIEKTEKYFKRWETLENCQVVEGDYLELFLGSDALIHDSGSFMTEYLALNKPIAYTLNEEQVDKRFNEFGQKVFSCHRLVKSEDEFRGFFLDVINDVDSLSCKRKELIAEYNLNPEELVSTKIIEYVKEQLQ